MRQKGSEDDNFEVASKTADKLIALRPVLKPTLFDKTMSIFFAHIVLKYSTIASKPFTLTSDLVENAQDRNIVVDSDDEDIPDWITKMENVNTIMENVNPIDGANREPILDATSPQAPIESGEGDGNAEMNGIEKEGECEELTQQE